MCVIIIKIYFLCLYVIYNVLLINKLFNYIIIIYLLQYLFVYFCAIIIIIKKYVFLI